jgi:hypothetical protein
MERIRVVGTFDEACGGNPVIYTRRASGAYGSHVLLNGGWTRDRHRSSPLGLAPSRGAPLDRVE